MREIARPAIRALSVARHAFAMTGLALAMACLAFAMTALSGG